MTAAKTTAKLAGLLVAYLVLFLGGVSVLGPAVDPSSLPPAEQRLSLPMIALVAAIDLALVGTWVARARTVGWRLWALTAAVTYGVKTFSSQLEAWYFIRASHLPPEMLPGLFAMTVPLAVGWTGLVVWTLGPRHAEPAPPLGRTPLDLAVRVLVAGGVLYPLAFFGFGYFVAWQSPALRAYYEGPAVALPPLAHFSALFRSDPWVLPFEVARGVLWVAMAQGILRTTRGPWWVGALLVGLILALVQNDVHLIPNPVMPAEVRWWHFVETAPSNFLFGLGAAGLLRPRTHTGPRSERGPG